MKLWPSSDRGKQAALALLRLLPYFCVGIGTGIELGAGYGIAAFGTLCVADMWWGS